MSYVDAELLFRCDYCGARIGHHCTTSSGRRSTFTHSARSEAVMSVVDLAGYLDELDAESRQRRALERAIRDLHTSLDQEGLIDPAWMRVRLVELLSVKS